MRVASLIFAACAHIRAAGGAAQDWSEDWSVGQCGGRRRTAGGLTLKIRTRRAGSLFDLKRGVRAAARRVCTAWPNYETYCFGPIQRTACETYSFQNLQLCNRQLCNIQPLKPTAFKNRQQAQPTTYNLLQLETYSLATTTYSFATTQMQYAASCNLNRLPLQPNCSCNRALANHQLPTALADNTVAPTATLA